MRDRVDSMSRLFLIVFMFHKYSFGGLGADTLTFCERTPFSGQVGGGGEGGGGGLAFSKAELRFPISYFLCIDASVCYENFLHKLQQKNRVYSPTLFPERVDSFWKTRSFFMNTTLYPRKELTLCVDSQEGRLGRYYRDFSPNYFEYWLCIYIHVGAKFIH